MKLDKSDALVVYSTIFSFVNGHRSIDKDTLDHLLDIQGDIHEFLTAGEELDEEEDDHCCDHDHDDDEEDEELDEEEDIDPDSLLTTQDASELAALIVQSVDGSKIDLEFEDIGDSDTVDALLDDGTIILDKVSHVRATKDEIFLFDGEEWHQFKVKKFPKAWSKSFPSGTTVGFKRGEE